MHDMNVKNPNSLNRLQLALIPIAALALIFASAYVLSSGNRVAPPTSGENSLVSVHQPPESSGTTLADGSTPFDVADNKVPTQEPPARTTVRSRRENVTAITTDELPHESLESVDTPHSITPAQFDISPITDSISPLLRLSSPSTEEVASVNSSLSDADSVPTTEPSPEFDTAQASSPPAIPDANSAISLPNQTPDSPLSTATSTTAAPSAHAEKDVKHVDRQLINPSDSQYPVHFILNDSPHTLHPGQSLSATSDMPTWILRYHRGGSFGETEHEVSPGIHIFRVSPQGWWTESLVIGH